MAFSTLVCLTWFLFGIHELVSFKVVLKLNLNGVDYCVVGFKVARVYECRESAQTSGATKFFRLL